MAAAPGVRRSELGEALRACRSAFIGVGVMSCMINLLYLTGSIFMLEIYDRVLPSRSVATLVGLVILAGGLYVAQGVLDLLRGRILGRVGTSLDEAINARVFETVVRLPLMVGGRNEGLQPLRDLDNVRSFLGSMGPGAFFDLPWLPFYLAICFAFHWLLGVTALVGAIILVTLTLITEFMSRAPAREAMGLAARRNDLAAAGRRNAEVLVAMGMSGRLGKRWGEANESYLAGNQRASDVDRRPRRGRKSPAHDAAIRRAGGRRLSRDPPGSHRRHHHRGFDPERAGACAGRSGDRALERLCRRAAELAPPQQAPAADAGIERADPAAGAVETAVGRGRQHRAAGRPARDRAGRHLRGRGRQRRRRHRAERLRQILAGARAGRRLDAGPRQGAAGRRGARSMVVGRARPPRRLSAAGRRIVRRHASRKTSPVSIPRPSPTPSSTPRNRPACTR